MAETRTQVYPGDRRNFDETDFIGANGRFWRPVNDPAPVYDSAANTTTISYVRVPMDELGARYGHLIDRAIDRMTISELFGTEAI